MSGIKWVDIGAQSAQLKKALAIIDVMVEDPDENEPVWLAAAAFDYVHDVIQTLEKMVTEATKKD